jgi:PKD repeat protein
MARILKLYYRKSINIDMKKIIFLSLVLPLILLSCEESPKAYFSASPSDPVVGEDVWFTNESENVADFEWDFGDGYISNEVNPVHKYTSTGAFTVILKVWSGSGLTDEASLVLNVKIPTLLEIEVLEYSERYPVEGASVILYPTLTDWENETSSVNEGFTDDDGKTVFADLDNIVYYVDVWEDTHDNYALKEDDIGFIRTLEIIPNKINRFVALVDYVEHSKGTAKRDRTIVIKKIERKSTDQVQPVVSSDTSGWQELYEKRANKK